MVVGTGIIIKNNSDYQSKVMASSMQKGEKLPQYGQVVQAELTLGNSKLSKDGKTLAVEIKYDSAAHTRLSSFGDRYSINLLTTPNNPMKDVKIQYGMFGTDGSGVLIIKSPKKFLNSAFIVTITDKNQLVTTSDLTGTSVTASDADITKSITAQLSGSDDQEQTSSAFDTSKKEEQSKLPPTFGVRINPANYKQTDQDWNNDRDIVKDLFVKDNLHKIEKNMNEVEKLNKKAQSTMKEMDQRLAENPADQVASDNKQQLQSTIDSFNAKLATERTNYDHIKNSVIETNILSPKQTKYYKKIVNSLAFSATNQ